MESASVELTQIRIYHILDSITYYFSLFSSSYIYHVDSNKLTFEGAGTVKIDDKNHPFTFKYYKVQLLESTSGETGSAVGSNIISLLSFFFSLSHH